MAATQAREEELRSQLKRKQQDMDELLPRSETLHPSAFGALQGQLEGEMEQLQAELHRLTAVAG
jgi:hypothetical protein